MRRTKAKLKWQSRLLRPGFEIMSERKINHAVAEWVRLGAMFNASPARHEVDLERSLLETARCAAGNSRLIILAVTWLAKYGGYVAKHRLARLILHELETEFRPTMGLMLDLSREKSASRCHRFNAAIKACGGAIDQRPLLDIDRQNGFFVHEAKRNASTTSLKWGRWIEDFELKADALRPASWIVQKNRSMRLRADFKGDLRASILAELDVNPNSGESESELARACGATRAATIEALRRLELSGRIRRRRERNRSIVKPTRISAA
jgi:hypothetical protein